ncbi:unnamed protein product [Paramecium pentaurelia]|uniref:Protein kinase domain-containing protein n=1 Tax=Paramecium pentaurelia TaxID=43138 RepID=A0A8S1WFM0_9CILI|nr:unnamed protein product [Paramecium pentaurelia]
MQSRFSKNLESITINTSNYNQTQNLIQISKISIPTLKIKASSIHLKQYNKNIKSIRNKKLHLKKLLPFINHNKIQTNSQQFHQFHLCKIQKNSLNKQTILLKLDISILIINITQQAEERFQNFKIRKKLGDGRHLQTGFFIAQKVIQKIQMIEEMIEAQEIKIQYLFDHPNITKLYTFFQTYNHYQNYLLCHQMFTLLITKSIQKNNQIKDFKKKKLLIMSIKQLLHQCTDIIMIQFIEIFNQIIFSQILAKLKLLIFHSVFILLIFIDKHFVIISQMLHLKFLKQIYRIKQCDIFGFGYLIYELCFGIPSWKEHQQELIKTVRYTCVIIPSQTSKELREIIENLVKRLHRERLTAKISLQSLMVIINLTNTTKINPIKCNHI